MAKGIEIGVGVDSRAAKRGIETGLIDPLEDADKALLDLGKNKGPDKLEKSLEGAQTATKKLEKETKETADAIESEYRTAYAKLKSSSDGAFDGVKQGADEAKNEIKSSAKEGAASFSGEFDDIGDFVQESLANAFEGFGPAGQAAGIAAAVGLGIVFAQLTEVKERSEQTRERVKGLVDQLFEVEGNTELLDYVEQLRDFLDKPAAGSGLVDQMADFFEQSGSNFDQAKRDAKTYGVALTDLLQSYSGADAKKAQSTIKELQKAQERLRESTGDYSMKDKYELEAKAIQGVIDKIKDQNGLTDQAVAEYEAITAATEDMTAAQEAAAAKLEAVADAASSLQGELDSAVTGFDDFKNAETDALDPAGYIASIEARILATQGFNSNVQSLATQFGLSTEEIQTLLDQGVDFAPMLQSIIDSGLAPEFVAQMQSAVGGGQDILNGNPLSTEVGVKANVEVAEKDIAGTSDKKRTAKVEAKAETAAADAALNATASKSRTATISASANTWQASRDIDALLYTRYVTIVASVVDRNGRAVP